MMKDISTYIAESREELLSLLEALCKIPAPSHHEQARAAFVKNWLEAQGATGVSIDEALNVIYPIGCEGSDEITVFVAHTDTVFPDTEPMPYVDDGELIRCPGVGDDTASLAVMLLLAKYYLQSGYTPKGGVMFVANSCEEGLGNLKGTRQIFADYKGRIKQFISLDSNIDIIADRCVGSRRFEVEVKTVGGHSYLDFGKKNAIAALSEIVTALYAIDLPQKAGSRVTMNVGEISGGTSVNTIAQSARMLCEYRSDDTDCMDYMQAEFSRIFAEAEGGEVSVSVKVIGDRPCAKGVDPAEIDRLRRVSAEVVEAVLGEAPSFRSSSTDCNIPLSLGIPAICVGVYDGGGQHTREEWVRKASLPQGLEIAIRLARELI